MSGKKQDDIDLGDLLPATMDGDADEMSDEELDKVAGGLRIRSGGAPRQPSKSGMYIPAPPAPAVPVPFPPGM